MNILVYPHELAMGGSQINAIELAAAVRDKGHNVIIAAQKGPLLGMIRDLGLRYILLPTYKGYPAIRTSMRLIQLARKLDIHLIHAYEWRPSLEAAFGPHMLLGTPMMMTCFSMEIPESLPQHLPLVVGTRELMQLMGRKTYLMEPPIDTEKNKLGDKASARSVWGFRDDEIVVCVVCRMTPDLSKAMGVLEAIDAIQSLATKLPLRFLVVGDGESLDVVCERAKQVNKMAGREIVVTAGMMVDPENAYAASDIMLGMGMSALKALAFSKPLIVQGAQGFWQLADPSTVDRFYWQGWFGRGGQGAIELKPILEKLAMDASTRLKLGEFGREVVVTRYSLDAAATQLIEWYDKIVKERQPFASRVPSVARSFYMARKHRIKKALLRIQRALYTDFDFRRTGSPD